ncbi:MAG: toxin-antitoxin system YwqK family antitoxin [Oligoflexia bacterium]
MQINDDNKWLIRKWVLLAGPIVLLFFFALEREAWPTERNHEEALRDRIAAECEQSGGERTLIIRQSKRGRVRSYQCVQNARTHGKHFGFYLPGLEKESLGQFCDGQLCGLWQRWSPSGAPLDRGEWRQGVPHGQWVIFRTGEGVAPETIRETGIMENGQKSCGWQVFNERGGLDEGAMAAFCSQRASRVRFGVGLGLSNFSHRERGVEFGLSTLTLKLGTRLPVSQAFSLGITAFMAAIALDTLVIEGQPTAVSYLGANFRLDYRLPVVLGPLRPSVAVGVSYGRMNVSGYPIGYGTMLYPQIFPSLAWPASFGNLALYAKYVPIGQGFLDLSLKTRELAVGLSLEPRIGGRALGWNLSLDYSDLAVRPEDRFLIESRAWTIGVGLLL